MNYRGNTSAMRSFLVRALSLSAAAALTLNQALAPVMAADAMATPVAAVAPAKTRFLALGIGKSVVIDLPRDVKDVLVADPKIANAVIRSPQRAYLIGETVGQTNVVFFDADVCAPRSSKPSPESRSRVSATAWCSPALCRAPSRHSRPATSRRGWRAAPTRL